VEREFRFDEIFDESTQTEQIFESVIVKQLERMLSGYNFTIFAYGPTGTGKTFTIFGDL